nr:HAD-IIIA family hydrolase [uncultured Rhodopila sp.]
MTTTVTQCAVLAGGLGTPTAALPCGDRPFLGWLLREFVRFGVTEFVLLTGHLSAEIERAVADIQASLPVRVGITLSEAPMRAGTGGAVYHARELLHDRFLLCNGDSLFDTNISALLADAAADSPDGVGRVVLRQLDGASRYGTVTLEGDRITAFREPPPAGTSGTVNAGIYLFRKSLIGHLRPSCSLEAGVLPALARDGLLRGTLGTGSFRDLGVPEDFARAQTEIPALLRRRALFLDRDGVLNVDHGYVGCRERFEWTEGAKQAIRHATSAGWHVFIVTNQSGVARGLYDEDAVRALLGWIADEARASGGTIDDARYCPYHPDGTDDAYRRAHPWRKPEPGMLLDLIRCWDLDPARAIMIGDQESDMRAAADAGVTGYLFQEKNLLAFLQRVMEKDA